MTMAKIRDTLGKLATVPDGRIEVVALGSPHFSLHEFEKLLPLIEQYPPHPQVDFIVCTNRLALGTLQKRGWLAQLQAAGVRVIVDTCVVVTPIVRQHGVLMTNSGKFAHYSPGNIGLEVIFGSLEECVRSAARGKFGEMNRCGRTEIRDWRLRRLFQAKSFSGGAAAGQAWCWQSH